MPIKKEKLIKFELAQNYDVAAFFVLCKNKFANSINLQDNEKLRQMSDIYNIEKPNKITVVQISRFVAEIYKIDNTVIKNILKNQKSLGA